MRHHIGITVLPLHLLSEEPRLALFSEGLVMDLITDLSRFRQFRIMPCSTVRTLHLDTHCSSGTRVAAVPPRAGRRRLDRTIRWTGGPAPFTILTPSIRILTAFTPSAFQCEAETHASRNEGVDRHAANTRPFNS